MDPSDQELLDFSLVLLGLWMDSGPADVDHLQRDAMWKFSIGCPGAPMDGWGPDIYGEKWRNLCLIYG
jgi:hypothetical protein